jgi:hypothetical protein
MRMEGKRTRFGKTTEVDEKHGKTLDMSGMSLDSVPNPSINLALVTKLDLSNNNLEVISVKHNYLFLKPFIFHTNFLGMACLMKVSMWKD